MRSALPFPLLAVTHRNSMRAAFHAVSDQQ